jgi:hypothetical protein
VGGGANNQAGDNLGTTSDSQAATVGGGWGNVASGSFSAIGGGTFNQATGDKAVVGGGYDNQSSGSYSVIGGGNQNISSGDIGYVGGGVSNSATGANSSIGGGGYNNATGQYSTVPGGVANTAAGHYSFAAGRGAKANHQGAFVFADSNSFDFASLAVNSFKVRATGGVRFVLGIDGSGNTTWNCVVGNGSSWSCSSDRNLKENLIQVDGQGILQRLSTLPIYNWNGKGIDPSVKHLGPMAQDFFAAFGLGDDDKLISTIDLDGVSLSAIQGLYQIVQEKDARINAQQQAISDLQKRLAAIELRLGLASAK